MILAYTLAWLGVGIALSAAIRFSPVGRKPIYRHAAWLFYIALTLLGPATLLALSFAEGHMEQACKRIRQYLDNVVVDRLSAHELATLAERDTIYLYCAECLRSRLPAWVPVEFRCTECKKTLCEKHVASHACTWLRR